jgi:hypothetical protein
MGRFDILEIGAERQRVVVVDDVAADPDGLRAAAAAQDWGPARHAYPGLRADLPADYWPDREAMVREAAAALGLPADPVALIDASFSLVTTPRAALSIGQRLPHCDSHEAGRLAFVHYLDPTAESGGTAFFRHRSTRFETVDRQRAAVYDGQLEAELRHGRPPAADYIGDDDPLFERIGAVPARYNRAVIYRSFALHSGVIPAGASLSPDPLNGRLTVTGFVSVG